MKSKLSFLPFSIFIAVFFFACNNSGKSQECTDEEGNIIPCEVSGCEGDGCENPGPGPGVDPNPGPGSRKLTVQGRQIMKNGQPIVLRGMSLYWYNGNWGGGQPGNSFYTQNTVNALANPNGWGANLVRAAIGNVNPTCTTSSNGPCSWANTSLSAVALAKNMMDWAYVAGIYVIIDNHSHNAHEAAPAAAAYNFFNEVSAYVKEKRNQGLDYNHVLYEVYNEPLNTAWATIKSYAEGAIAKIRANDPDGIILVGTRSYSSRVDEPFQMNSRIDGNGKNIMYVLHYYASEASHNNFQNYLKMTYCNDIPVFVTEWGTGAANGSGTINIENNNKWMSLIEGAKVSWANWSLVRASETTAALTTNMVDGETTQSGTMVKNWIRELNAGRTVSGINPYIDCN